MKLRPTGQNVLIFRKQEEVTENGIAIPKEHQLPERKGIVRAISSEIEGSGITVGDKVLLKQFMGCQTVKCPETKEELLVVPFSLILAIDNR